MKEMTNDQSQMTNPMPDQPEPQTCWVSIPDLPGRYLRLQFITEEQIESASPARQETTTAAELITALQSITFRNLRFSNPH